MNMFWRLLHFQAVLYCRRVFENSYFFWIFNSTFNKFLKLSIDFQTVIIEKWEFKNIMQKRQNESERKDVTVWHNLVL